jgi:hypothetical protein
MKQEFKKGDRVLVRKTDLHEWTPAVFDELDNLSHWFKAAVLNDGYRGVYYQCRHIDDFRTFDKVQVRDSARMARCYLCCLRGESWVSQALCF